MGAVQALVFFTPNGSAVIGICSGKGSTLYHVHSVF